MKQEVYTEEPWQDFRGESPKNIHAKCLWCLLIDTSSSMEPHMQELITGLHAFKSAVENDPVASDRIEVSIVEFNGEVKVRCAPKLIDELHVPEFSAGSYTFMAEGLERGIQVIDSRVQWYQDTSQPFYVPFLILITDGEPNGPGDVHQVAKTIRKRAESSRRSEQLVFQAFGVTDANMEILKGISVPEFPPVYVQNADFASLFQWLSTSTKIVSNSTPGDTKVPQLIAASVVDQDNFQREV